MWRQQLNGTEVLEARCGQFCLQYDSMTDQTSLVVKEGQEDYWIKEELRFILEGDFRPQFTATIDEDLDRCFSVFFVNYDEFAAPESDHYLKLYDEVFKMAVVDGIYIDDPYWIM